ncbi:hypothetical protein MFIFM68171_07671 [Madurella fahalii]|uniref:Rhodopsin domain-containing protein n=1 Tax=Madurella fahalii TaxID=1157608 RepID=A0ABQ0GI77_9PEZI
MSGLNISTDGSPISNSSSSSLGAPPSRQNGTDYQNNTADATAADTADTVLSLSPTIDVGPQINFTIWLLTALSAAFLALRVYCKFLRHRGLWWDDHVLIASWLSLVASSAFVSQSINLGFGRPLSQFNFDDLEIFLLFSNLAGTFSILAALWSKTSFAITVLRISSGWVKVLVWFIILTVNGSLGVAIAITWGQCTPIEKIWRPSLEGECWPKGTQIQYNIFTAIYSGAMDIVLAVLPWKIIWTLTMNKKEKFGVLVAMSMGVFAGVTSIIKITQLPSISNDTFTESTTELVILAAAEGAITIIAASIPILRALLRGSQPPPGPAQFYHMDISLYTGDENSRGTGRSSTVISSSGHRHSRSHSRSIRSASPWSKEMQPIGSFRGLSRLSRFSGFSLAFRSSTSGLSTTGRSARESSASLDSPPPGKIIQTEEVVVEYETTAGRNTTYDEWPAIGRAV